MDEACRKGYEPCFRGMTMKTFPLILMVGLLAGCCGMTAEESTYQAPAVTPGDSNVTVQPNTTQEDETPVPGADGTIIEAPPGPGPTDTDYPESIATSQNDCSTMAPNCDACLAKKGCNWCKTSNACYYEGIVPTISSCYPGDWVDSVEECAGPKGGSSCSEKTNCADCLSGSGCQWCIQGSVCSSEETTEDCFGGWLTESYQCNFASR
jgi:hypothetical protein